MLFEPTPIQGCFIIRLQPFKDNRGFFARTFCAREFNEHGLDVDMVQSNWSGSIKKHTLRGMHYQTHGSEEAKLVRCISGRILDVCIDIRRDSDTFGQHIMVELTAMNDAMLYLPRGTAHGFLSLDDNCQVFYQVSSFYDPVNERGIRWNDPFFSINWPVTHPILSEKDQSYADFLK
jgi:dTDP-4-dehydrorhamnose 3,5-epimerase